VGFIVPRYVGVNILGLFMDYIVNIKMARQRIMTDSPFKGMVIELPPEQYDRAMAAISRASAAIGALRNQLIGKGESMCDFISWFQKDDAVIFLTDDDLATKAGKKLRAIDGMFPDDIKGHGAIQKYYELNDWSFPADFTQKECTDFSTPNNFPPQIVEAIKKCNLTQIGVLPDCVFTKAGLVKVKADAEWKKAGAEWKKAYAELKKAYAEREKVDAEWRKADAEWRKADAGVKWKVFADPKNRKKAWR
jgi:hypothetical protein